MRYILALALACACAFGQPKQNSNYGKLVPFGSDPASTSCSSVGAGAYGVYGTNFYICDGSVWTLITGGPGGTQIGGYFTSTTGSDTYVMTTSNVTTLTNGVYVFTASTTNTSSASLDWNGSAAAGGVVTILTEFGSTLVDGMISTTSPNLLYYNGTNFLLMFSSRVMPNATGYQWARMYSPDGIFWAASFFEGTPSTGPTAITSASNTIDPSGRSYVQVAPTSNLTLTSTPSIVAGTFDGQRLTINDTSASYTLTIKNGPTYNTCIGADQTIAANGGGLSLRWIQANLCWGLEQTPGSGTGTVAALQGYFMPSEDSTSGNVALTAANKMYIQSIFVKEKWLAQKFVAHLNTGDTLGSLCLYSWGGPGVTTATLFASTTPGTLSSASPSHLAISQGAVTINPGWYIVAFTGNGGTLAAKRGAQQAYMSPLPGSEIDSGVTDGSCPASLSSLSSSTTFGGYGWRLRIGWEY
jgi:hypothetical protein